MRIKTHRCRLRRGKRESEREQDIPLLCRCKRSSVGEAQQQQLSEVSHISEQFWMVWGHLGYIAPQCELALLWEQLTLHCYTA